MHAVTPQNSPTTITSTHISMSPPYSGCNEHRLFDIISNGDDEVTSVSSRDFIPYTVPIILVCSNCNTILFFHLRGNEYLESALPLTTVI